MKNLIYFMFFCICCNNVLLAQKSDKFYKTVFAEWKGSSYNYSLNYDMRLKKGVKDGFGFRLGAEYVSQKNDILKYYEKRVVLPFEVNYLKGNYLHYLDVGVGSSFNYIDASFGNDNTKKWLILMVPSVGYRYQGKKGLMIRANYTPNFNFQENSIINHRVGFGLGYSF